MFSNPVIKEYNYFNFLALNKVPANVNVHLDSSGKLSCNLMNVIDMDIQF